MTKRISRLACEALLVAATFAQDDKRAGRTLDNFESSIHEQLAAVPSYRVFDSIRFEVAGRTVTLSGHVVKDSLKRNAERTVSRIDGFERVDNQIEVLPAPKSDDALRTNVYREIYEKQPLGKFGAAPVPPSHHREKRMGDTRRRRGFRNRAERRPPSRIEGQLACFRSLARRGAERISGGL